MPESSTFSFCGRRGRLRFHLRSARGGVKATRSWWASGYRFHADETIPVFFNASRFRRLDDRQEQIYWLEGRKLDRI
jgi:hypothetical protein